MKKKRLDKGDIVYIPAHTQGKKIIKNRKTYFGEHTVGDRSLGFCLSEYREDDKIYLYNISSSSYWVVRKDDIYTKEKEDEESKHD